MPLLKEGLSASNRNPRGPRDLKRENRIKREGSGSLGKR